MAPETVVWQYVECGLQFFVNMVCGMAVCEYGMQSCMHTVVMAIYSLHCSHGYGMRNSVRRWPDGKHSFGIPCHVMEHDVLWDHGYCQ